MTITSFGPANTIARAPETHPLTWRLRDDGELLKIFEPYRIDVTAVP